MYIYHKKRILQYKMPRPRENFGRRIRHTNYMKVLRSQQIQEKRTEDNEIARNRMLVLHQDYSQE